MKSTAQHTHPAGTVVAGVASAEGVVCWWDHGFGAWFTQLPEDYVDPGVDWENDPAAALKARHPTQNVPCPDPEDLDAIATEIGRRDEQLIAGDAPHEILEDTAQ